MKLKSQCFPPSLIPSSSYFLRQGLSVDLKLTDLAKLAGQQASEILFSLLPQPWDYRQSTCLFTWELEIESAYTTYTLPAGHLPRP